MSTLIGMMVGSRQSTITLVRNSLRTILDRIGDDVMIAVAIAPYLPKDFLHLVADIERMYPGKILTFPLYEGSWAQFANLVIDMSMDFKWTIFSHDDVQLISDDFIPVMEGMLDQKRDTLGWISFLDWDYLRSGWAPSIREGFHIDAVRENAWSRKKIHNYHNLPENWYSPGMPKECLQSLPWDIPEKPIRCHAPFSHLIAIKSDTLRTVIRKCENWSPVSLMVDEDWGLTALKNGLFNIWIPQLAYCHMRTLGGTRASPLIQQYGKFVHNQFRSKWGFMHKCIYTPSELKDIRRRFSRTNIPWSMDRRSYEWDYVQ